MTDSLKKQVDSVKRNLAFLQETLYSSASRTESKHARHRASSADRRSNSIAPPEVYCNEVKTNERYLISTVKALERDNANLQKLVDKLSEEKYEFDRELSHLKTTNRLQELKIEHLMRELQYYKRHELQASNPSLSYDHADSLMTPSPPSIMRNSSGSPRRNRVAFDSALKVAKYHKNDFKIVMVKSRTLKDNSQLEGNFLDRVEKSRDMAK